MTSFFNHEVDYLSQVLGKDSIPQKKLQDKIREYNEASKKQGLMSLLEEDISEIISKYGEEILRSKAQKINKSLDDITKSLEEALSAQTNKISSLELLTDDFTQELNSIFSEENIQNPSLDIKTICSNLNVDSCLDFNVEEGLLCITQTKKSARRITIDLEEWKGIRKVELYLGHYEFNQEDLRLLNYIFCIALEGLKHFGVIGEQDGRSPKRQLISILSFIVGRCQNLRSLCVNLERILVNDESIIFLAEKILSKASQLDTFLLNLFKSRITNRAIEAVAKAIHPLANNFKTLHLYIGETNVTEDVVIKLFNNTPAVRHLGFALRDLRFGDKGLENLVVKTLSSIESLNLLWLYLGETDVTDASVKKLFACLKDVKELYLYLDSTKITDVSAIEFLQNQTLIKSFKILDISVAKTKVSSTYQGKIQDIMRDIKKK